ncbi:hypothetical protein AYO39_02410 [Actinobacteria bacterium SCGC AG-212-D09]|nr:hypothetical protein AYO39_02410 [Actinobacteria bacterium SCGC AG-212-D09]
MGLYMRAVVLDWEERSIDDLVAFASENERELRLFFPRERNWREFEVHDEDGQAILEGDLAMVGQDELASGEVKELTDSLAGLDGASERLDRVRDHLASAHAIVALRILPSGYDAAVDAANVIFWFLEQRPGVLAQIDGVGWYDHDQLILSGSA